MKMKDPKDILKEVRADMLGVSPDDITFSNFRDRKRKKKKVKKVVESESNSTIIDNDEGFGVISRGVEFCSYDKIGSSRKVRKRNRLEEWGAFDFFYYAEEKFKAKYGKSMRLNVGGNSVEINRIRDKFYDLFGFCCNLIMRDYIDFFFNNYMNTLIREDGAFYFRQMRNDKIICEFYNGYNFKQSFLKYSENEKSKIKAPVSDVAIKEAYDVGDTSLVSNYGIVISFNWLMIFKKMSPADAARLVLNACRELNAKNMTDVVRSSTEVYSPYPSSLPFKNPQKVMDRINTDIKLDVEFNDNDKYEFLQVKEK